MTIEPEVSQADIERMIDEEKGTVFDWMQFPTHLELQKDRVIDRPDRVWVGEVIEMLKTDGQAAGVEQALTMPLRQANLTIEKPDRDGSGRITTAVEEALFKPAVEGGMRTPFELVFAQMTFASASARTFHELVWTRGDNGRLTFGKIAWRPPAACELIRDRQTGERRGYRQFVDWDSTLRNKTGVDWEGYTEIPEPRAVVHINNQHKDPLFGWSDLSVTHWAYKLKCQILQLWFTLLKRNSLPWMLAYGKDSTEARDNAKQISGLLSGGVASVVRPNDPTTKMYEVLDTASNGAALYDAAIRYCDGMMSQSVLGGWMDLAGAASQSGKGSYALSADQSGLFLASRHAAARELCATVNYDIIRPFVRVNFGPKAPVPRLKVEKIGSDQVAKAMEMLSTLGSAQNTQVPVEFIGMLIERVAAYLDLPDDRVRKVVAEHAKQAREQAKAQGAPMPAEGTEAGTLQDAVAGAMGAVGAAPEAA